jgi:hypothetical protein
VGRGAWCSNTALFFLPGARRAKERFRVRRVGRGSFEEWEV